MTFPRRLIRLLALIVVSFCSSRPIEQKDGSCSISNQDGKCKIEAKAPTLVDISPYIFEDKFSEEDRLSVSKQWSEAFENLGVAQIVGHGVPMEMISSLRSEAQEFFKGPTEEKKNYTFGPYGTAFGGYTAVGSESVAQSVEGVEAPPDLVENFVFRCLGGGDETQPTKHVGGWQKLPFSTAKMYIEKIEQVLSALHRISADALQRHIV